MRLVNSRLCGLTTRELECSFNYGIINVTDLASFRRTLKDDASQVILFLVATLAFSANDSNHRP